jgi:hypothetical protein
MFRKNGYYRTDHFFSTDLGVARNIGASTSLGGTVFLGAPGTMGEQLGMRLRVVSWVSRQVSIDIAPGVFFWEKEPSGQRLKSPGVASQASLNLGGRLGAVLQVLSANREQRYYSRYLYPPYSYDTHETTWHLGIRLGGELGIAGAAAFLMAEAAGSGRKYYPVDY